MSKKRFILALILTPIISSLVFNIVEKFPIERFSEIKLIFALIPIFSIFTFLGLIVFGLPAYFLLKKYQLLNFINLILAGGITGVIYMLLFPIFTWSKTSSIDMTSLFYGSLMGAMTSLIFAVIAGVPVSRNKTKAL